MKKSSIQMMMENAKLALRHAYAPYSTYLVAACLSTVDDKLFTGVNVENASYGLTLCAEASAICQMIAAGQQQIKSMVILNGDNTLSPPCGACRQRIIEFSTPETIIHLCNHNNVLQSHLIDELLPLAFRLHK